METADSLRSPWGWAGTVGEYLNAPAVMVLSALNGHLHHLLGVSASASQQSAWREEEELLRVALRALAVARPACTGWGLTLEYELHLEGGRRPDAVVHTGAELFVLEFKQSAEVTVAAEDQVVAYARDLAEYHQATHGLPVHPVLVLTREGHENAGGSDPYVISGNQIAGFLQSKTEASARVDLAFRDWLEAAYEPLPTLVEAARMIFSHEPLPHIRRAESVGIPEAVALLNRLCKEADRDSQRMLALLAGVPGAGKTLTGLQLVYDRQGDANDAVFLSGNGPLVEVLRHALKSKAFVQDLHAFVKTYGRSNRTPTHHIIVFDEAQRAWDAGFMAYNGQGDRSEPEVLIDVGERIDRWCAMIGLVGDGQEIHSGEEGGIGQWEDALVHAKTSTWRVCVPSRLAGVFETVVPETYDELDLTLSLRSRRAEDLHAWVAALLKGDVLRAARTSRQIEQAEFTRYLTRDLEHAKAFLRSRYEGESSATFGIVASSKSQRFLPKYGVDSTWPATKSVKMGPWFNSRAGEPGSAANLSDVVTEFGCQGLELDMPLVAWGDDLTWNGRGWRVKSGRARYPQTDPVQLRLNAYRVLLTRGRDGFVIFAPEDPILDQTVHVLLATGVKPLPEA